MRAYVRANVAGAAVLAAAVPKLHPIDALRYE